MSAIQNMASQVILNEAGIEGSKALLTGANTPTSGKYFYKIESFVDMVVSAQVDVTGSDNVDLTALTNIPKNSKVYGKWSSITLTSGEGVGYYAKS